MSCECATRPGAHAETLSGRLPGHPPSVFRTRHVSPNAPSGKSLRKPPELATRSECLAYTSRKPRVRRETSECDFTGSLQKRHVSREAYFPGHTASAPRVDHPGNNPSVYYRKFQKMVVTSKIHRNSSLNRKNHKPIFTVSF